MTDAEKLVLFERVVRIVANGRRHKAGSVITRTDQKELCRRACIMAGLSYDDAYFTWDLTPDV